MGTVGLVLEGLIRLQRLAKTKNGSRDHITHCFAWGDCLIWVSKTSFCLEIKSPLISPTGSIEEPAVGLDVLFRGWQW